MKITSLVLVVLAAVCTSASTPPPKLPNIGYVGYGYNIFSGNPHATGSFDPGFGQAPLFDLTYNKQTTTPDGHWTIPDDVGIPGTATACSVEGDSTTIKTASDYQQSLSVDASASFSGFGAAFSASVDYQTVQKDTSSAEDVFVSTTASCQTYLTNINAFLHPNLSDVLVGQGSLLPTTYDPTTAAPFWQFFDLLGTHFPSQMTFGSRWGYSFQSTAQQWSQLNSMSIDVSLAANYAGMIKAGVSVNVSSQQSMASTFSENTINTYTYSLGQPPPANGDESTWLATALTSNLMSPLRYSFVNISVLFGTGYSTIAALNERQTAVDAALAQYCQLHLLPAGRVNTCAAPPLPPPPPPLSGYGALACLPPDSHSSDGDCYYESAAVYNAVSATQAQEVVLDFCPTCEIQISFPDEGLPCCTLAIGPAPYWAWAVDATSALTDSEAIGACNNVSHTTSCYTVDSGCAAPPPLDAIWGAIACKDTTCDDFVATQNGQGYTDRIETHQQLIDELGPGSFIVIDFFDCGALIKDTNGGWVSTEGSTPQIAEQQAMQICQENGGQNCAPAIYSCTTSSLIRRKSNRSASRRVVSRNGKTGVITRSSLADKPRVAGSRVAKPVKRSRPGRVIAGKGKNVLLDRRSSLIGTVH